MRFALVMLVAISAAVNANGVVIATVGKTVDITPLIQHIAYNGRVPKKTLSSHDNLNRLYAVTSKRLSQGKVRKKILIKSGITIPFFMLGTDVMSTTWLTRNCPLLQHAHATGIVVQSKGEADFNRLQQVCHIRLTPMNGDVLAQHFGLTHYPVLLTPHYWEQ